MSPMSRGKTMETLRLTSYMSDLESTVKLMYQLVREIYAIESDGGELSRIHEIAEALERRPNLTALPQVLLKAYGEITGALGGIRLSRETIQVHAVDRIRRTHAKLAEVSSATESATTELLNGLDRALGIIDRLEQHGNGEALRLDDGRTAHQAIRDEVNGLFNVLQFQDITSQQLNAVNDLLVDVEQRLVAVALLFDPAVGEDAPMPILLLPDPNAGPAKAYDQAASTTGADKRQALADAVMAETSRRGHLSLVSA